MSYIMQQPVPAMVGIGAIKELPQKLISDYNAKKVMVVCDAGVKAAGIADKVCEALTAGGITCSLFDGILFEAPDYNCDELGEKIRSEGCQAVIAVGGGSTLDASRGACTVALNGGSVRDYLVNRPFRLNPDAAGAGSAMFQKKTYKMDLPLICVPTTSGTGAEMRFTGTIHDTDLHLKDSVVYYPSLAVLDAELLTTMPPFVTATTAFDAMAHANESMTSAMGQKSLRNQFVGAGVTETVFKWLPVVMKDPENLEGRQNLAVAATLGALGSLDGVAHMGHAIAEYCFGLHFNQPHGYACAISLGPSIQYAAPYAVESLKRLARAQGVTLTGRETPEEVGAIVCEKYMELAHACGIPSVKERVGITREEMLTPQIVADVRLNKAAMAQAPSGTGYFTDEEIITTLNRIYDYQ